jgi:DNA-binding transcriptional regulator YdaS (Cro superfamily)
MDTRLILKRWIERESTQAKFARRVRMSRAHLCNFLKGRRRVSAETALRIHRAIGGTIPVEALVLEKTPQRRRAVG